MSSNGGLAWQALLALLRTQKPRMAAIFAPFDLTPQLAHAIHAIPPGGFTMRALAGELACDASNATGIVDRLERRGLIERSNDPADRRVKWVCLTDEGRRVRARIEARMSEAPPPIAALSAADQQALREILERAVAHAEAERPRPGA